MGKIKIQVGKKDIEQAQSSGDFEQAPVGVYTAVLKSVEPGHAKGDDGKPDKDRPYLACVWQIDGTGRSGAKLEKGKNYSQLWDYVSFSEAAKWKMAQFALAIGLPIKNGAISASIEIEEGKPGTIIGSRVILSVRADKDLQGEYKASVRGVYPLDEGDSELFDDDGDEDEDELGDDDDFDGEDDDDESEPDSGDMLTRDGLEEEGDLKALGSIAKEFDLDPKDYIVKTKAGKLSNAKTKSAIIDAILEAQGADEDVPEDDDIDDDEDPF